MRTACVLASAILLASCTKGVERPAEQVAYAAEVKRMKAEWDETEHNDLLRSRVEARARKFFHIKRVASGWVVEADSVKKLAWKMWVEAKADGVRYVLNAPQGEQDALLPLLEELQPGDRLVFNGEFVGETSFTVAGALESPEVSVTLSKIELFKD